MIEKIDISVQSGDAGPIKVIEEKLNELIDAFNDHVHYARELQYPTSTPDNPRVFE